MSRSRRSRPRSRSPRASRERRASRNMLLAALGAGAFLVAAVALFAAARQLHPELDPVTFCPVDRPVEEEHLILLDATDAWDPLQRQVILQEFRQLQSALPRFARVHLYTIERSDNPLPQPELVLCNPGRASDLEPLPILGSLTPAVVANPEQMLERWEQGFIVRMDSTLGQHADSPPADHSRIMETLRGAAVETFGRPGPDSPPRYVHVFSDLLQNSSSYSHYSAPRWTQAEAETLADPGRLGTRALEGAEIEIYLIDRPVFSDPGRQRGDLVAFWDRYLAAQGAPVRRVARIEG